MLIVSAVLVAGIFCAGCTNSGSATTQSGTNAGSTVQPQSTTSANVEKPTGASSSATPDQAMAGGDDKQINQTAGPSGAPPSGMMMNGTRPSGTPPSGMAMNGTRPSGTPPSGGGQPPSGTPPSGTPPTGH